MAGLTGRRLERREESSKPPKTMLPIRLGTEVARTNAPLLVTRQSYANLGRGEVKVDV
jgi:hypothetical protein